MAKRFTIASNIRNGYAAMGGNMARPVRRGAATGRSIAESIAAERARAARMAAAIKKK